MLNFVKNVIVLAVFVVFPILAADNSVIDSKNQNESVINVCVATDDNYAQHAAVTIASILKNADLDDMIRIYVIHSGLSQENIDKLTKLKNIRKFDLVFCSLDPTALKKFDLKTNALPVSTFLRIFIPELCKNAGDRILYMDVDVVVTGSLKELWNTDLEGNAVGVVDDYQFTYKDSHTNKVFGRKNMRYFNAGVMLFDLKKCEEFNIFERAVDFWVKYSDKIIFADQDMLNESCYGVAKYLHPKFNRQNISLRTLYKKMYSGLPNKDEVREAIQHPVIVHFASISKPWKFWSNNPNRYEYYKYLNFTEWKDNISFIADIRYDIVMFFKNIYYKIIDAVHNLL